MTQQNHERRQDFQRTAQIEFQTSSSPRCNAYAPALLKGCRKVDSEPSPLVTTSDQRSNNGGSDQQCLKARYLRPDDVASMMCLEKTGQAVCWLGTI